MTTDRNLTVTIWSPSQSPIIAAGRTNNRFWPPAIFGLAGTLLLHTLVLQSALMCGLPHKRHLPEILQPGLSLGSISKPAESLVFIDLSKTPNTGDAIDQSLAYLRAALESVPIAVTPPDSPPLVEFETLALEDEKPAAPSVESGDGTERARLMGIYTGQIHARIDRIWRRPRSLVNEHAGFTNLDSSGDSFQCQIQIVQDTQGYVREVLLPNCNGTALWQRSLVLAIQQASPLPAPPSPSVFSHSIALHFVAVAYAPGASEEDYEILPGRTAQSFPTLPTSRPANSISDSASRTPGSLSSASDSTVEQSRN